MAANDILIDTAAMKDCADRLSAAAQAVEAMQHRLNAALPDDPRVRKLADSNDRLGKCIRYLKDTATDFEATERAIAGRF